MCNHPVPSSKATAFFWKIRSAYRSVLRLSTLSETGARPDCASRPICVEGGSVNPIVSAGSRRVLRGQAYALVATAGSLADRSPGLDTARVSRAIVAAFSERLPVELGELPQSIVDEARSLMPGHLPQVA